MDARVAKRYAKAIFQAAQKADMVEAVEADFAAISHLVDTHDQFRGFLQTPRISRDDKIGIAEKLFSDRITSLSMSMLRLILSKRREAEFEGIREEYVRMRREHGQVTYIIVTSWAPLDDTQRKAITEKVASQTGKRVEADFAVDTSLLGGVKVAVGNHVLDGTVRGTLNRLRDRLKYDLLKQS
jgi:F-type H+-transporting ATPase subunit delta